MRSDSDSGWTSVTTSLKSEAMRKKNLSAKACYFFRVKPNMVKEEERVDYTMSLPSASASLAQLSPQVAALVGGAGATLINGRGDRISAASLAGKVVAVYCSASWCGPCRQFTPRLAQFYAEMHKAGKPFEVVFMSCDRDLKSFTEYLSHMPWTAVSYDAAAREQALASLGVQGIPHLTVLGRNGQTLETNAVQKQMSVASMDAWLAGRGA
mmetsp:Transcript_78986/g.115673  ORF Transcript_78986/g.115673 Transcript_78986/m.115673 type:complete len:211 (-) Transcript_78986:758-1390(-)